MIHLFLGVIYFLLFYNLKEDFRLCHGTFKFLHDAQVYKWICVQSND